MAQNVALNITQFGTAEAKCRPGYERSRSIVTRGSPGRMDAFKSGDSRSVRVSFVITERSLFVAELGYGANGKNKQFMLWSHGARQLRTGM